MKKSDVYLKAAELCDQAGIAAYACDAIGYASGHFVGPYPSGKEKEYLTLRREFAAMFKPSNAPVHGGWYGECTVKNSGPRVLALLFAHHIAKDSE